MSTICRHQGHETRLRFTSLEEDEIVFVSEMNIVKYYFGHKSVKVNGFIE